ncbi:NAD-dependent epimerase/dehydratase family protein [Caulobacter sp. UC70_42]|uniref:NAD-dependent epimerase/dehydratase family protein n=1 Tax=Caulobacter sp. UC70_42 TaxID=3374551 RepID=UPI003757B61E
MNPQHVLVTGGSGFIAGHCILHLLEQGHVVRATIRSLAKEATARGVLRDAGMVHADRLSFVAADLLDDDGWAQAMAGMDIVLHVASPVQPGRVAGRGRGDRSRARRHVARAARGARGAGGKAGRPDLRVPRRGLGTSA